MEKIDMIFRKETFMAYEYFPIDWIKAVKMAREQRFNYICFNGAVFSIDDCGSLPNYNRSICSQEDLVEKVWFTSDTHFGSKRTLKLSKRPFESVEEMDEAIINNWNSVVGEYDVVFHLGDFGNYDKVKELKGKVILLYGNYEKDDEKTNKDMSSYLRSKGFYHVVIMRKVLATFNFNDEKVTVCMTHKPSDINPTITSDNRVNLFGHIHKLQMIKKRGLNVGVDCHDFKPIDLDTVMFYINAIQNHYDEDVFIQ